jgi:hypothetical protein
MRNPAVTTSAFLLMLVSTPTLAGTRDNPQRFEELIDALVSAPTLVEYVNSDGGHASVVEEHEDGGRWIRPVKEAFAIVDLGPRAIPLLIQHLTDGRLTHAQFRSNGNAPRSSVPVGFICLDILIGITEDDAALFVPDCGDDGMGACVNAGFYFLPHAFTRTSKGLRASQRVRAVQANWRAAFEAGRVKYGYKAPN